LESVSFFSSVVLLIEVSTFYPVFLLKIDLDGRFFVKERICAQSGNPVCKEVVNAALAGMFNIANIFQFIINSLNNRSFAKKDFIP
jgi:hypothetical protein